MLPLLQLLGTVLSCHLAVLLLLPVCTSVADQHLHGAQAQLRGPWKHACKPYSTLCASEIMHCFQACL